MIGGPAPAPPPVFDLSFQVLARDPGSRARLGRLTLAHGAVETPAFMPVGTQGTVKAMSQRELDELGYRILLGNTYHLHLRPGEALIREAGGLHGFMGWRHNLLTDSGGFQVYSLQDLRRITEDGVEFRSHVDGSTHFFSPEGVVDIQLALGSDVLMAFDDCAPYPSDHAQTLAAMERTHRWAVRCRDHWIRRREENPSAGGQLFGIVQGGTWSDLRARSAGFVAGLDLPGIAVGGVSVGEPKEEMRRIVAETLPLLPEEKPRYLMGVGTPEDLLECVAQGVDMFDCVLPSRLGRNGSAYTSRGRINLKNARFAADFRPIDPDCTAWCCREHTAAYVRHLYKCDEILAARILSYHNLALYAGLMKGIRESLREGRFESFRREFLARYRSGGEGVEPTEALEEEGDPGALERTHEERL